MSTRPLAALLGCRRSVSVANPRWRGCHAQATVEYRHGKCGGSMVIEQRISRLEGAYEQVDRRLDEMHQAINGLRGEMNSLRGEMNSRFNTLYVLIAASWVTISGAMIGL